MGCMIYDIDPIKAQLWRFMQDSEDRQYNQMTGLDRRIYVAQHRDNRAGNSRGESGNGKRQGN